MKRVLQILLPILVLGALIFWRVDQKMADKASQGSQRAARRNAAAIVSLAPVQVRDIAHFFQTTGSVEAPLNVRIAPKITGRIESLDAQEGDIVRKGQVLARIDSMEVEADVQQAAAAVAQAQYRLAQAQLTQDPTDVAISTQISQQTAAVASATAEFKQAQASLNSQVAAAQAGINEALSRVESAKAAIGAADAGLANAKIKRDRKAGLLAKGFAAQQDVDDAEAALLVQKAGVDVANAQLNAAHAQLDSARQQLKTTQAKGVSDVEAARANLSQAKDSLKYARSNVAQKPAYRQSIAALKASVKAAQSALNSAVARRQYTVLTSPLDGFVTDRSADPGAIASPTQPMLTVQSIRQVWVNLPVPEGVSAKIRLGQPARIAFDAYAGRVFTAKVIQINPAADIQSRQFNVRVAIDNPGYFLKPGMFGRVSIQTGLAKNLTAVPREAVETDADGDYVMVFGSDETASRRPVTQGEQDDKFISVDGALKPGEQVVVMSSTVLKDGQKVSIGGKGADGDGRGRPGRPSGSDGQRKGGGDR